MEALFNMRMSVGLNFIKEIAEDPSLSPVDQIDMALTGYVERVKTNRHFYKVILAEQATNKNKNVLKFLSKSRETYNNFFQQVLKNGYADGSFKNEVDPVLLITTITGTLMQSLLNKQLYANHCGVKATDDWIRNVYFETVKTHLKTITKSILGYEIKN